MANEFLMSGRNGWSFRLVALFGVDDYLKFKADGDGCLSSPPSIFPAQQIDLLLTTRRVSGVYRYEKDVSDGHAPHSLA